MRKMMLFFIGIFLIPLGYLNAAGEEIRTFGYTGDAMEFTNVKIGSNTWISIYTVDPYEAKGQRKVIIGNDNVNYKLHIATWVGITPSTFSATWVLYPSTAQCRSYIELTNSTTIYGRYENGSSSGSVRTFKLRKK